MAAKDERESEDHWLAQVISTPEDHLGLWYLGTHGQVLKTAQFKPLYHRGGGTKLTFSQAGRRKRKRSQDTRWTGKIPVAYVPALVVGRNLRLTPAHRLTAPSHRALSGISEALTHARADDPNQG